MSEQLNNIKTVALEGQSFLDIALKGGSMESIFYIDPNISITDDPVIGKEYTVGISKAPISQFYHNREIEPATMLSENDLSIITPDDGIGSMSIENSFYIR